MGCVEVVLEGFASLSNHGRGCPVAEDRRLVDIRDHRPQKKNEMPYQQGLLSLYVCQRCETESLTRFGVVTEAALADA